MVYPDPEVKKYRGEMVSVVTDIPRWTERKDVVLDIQLRITRSGQQPRIHFMASVLRIPSLVTRTMFLGHLQRHLTDFYGMTNEVEFIFYKNRIWPEGSTLALQVQHCHTFVIMLQQVLRDIGNEASDMPASQDVWEEETTETTIPEASRHEREVDERSEEIERAPDDSSDESPRGLYTFMAGTEEGVRRYDVFLRLDASNHDIMDFIEDFLHGGVILQEVTGAPGFAVERQRIFVVIVDTARDVYLSLQRRFHGREQETFKILRIRGMVNYDIYERHFLQEEPLDVFLGLTSWISTPYRRLQAGSLVTVKFPDPQGGAYSFEIAPAESSGFSLLQIFASRTSGRVRSERELGNAEEAPRVSQSYASWPAESQNSTLDVFSRLPPPGNPDHEKVRLSLWSELSSTDRALDEAQICPGSPKPFLVLDDGEDESAPIAHPRRSITIDIPAQLGDIVRLLVHWNHCPLCVTLPEDFETPPIAMQFLLRCIAGWGERIESVHIYTDGSSRHCNDETRSSFAFLVFGFDGKKAPMHFFLGWFAHDVITDPSHRLYTGASHCNAKEAEPSALIWANIWLLQSGITRPTWFHYDALSVGNVMIGKWNLHVDWTQGRKLRELVQLSQHLRAGCAHHYEHCKAHSLQPRNELTDSIAKSVNSDDNCKSEVDPNLDWDTLFHAEDARLSWAWWCMCTSFGNEYPKNEAQGVQVASEVCRHPSWKIRPIERTDVPAQKEVFFAMRVGSYNALTLHAKKDDDTLVSESTRAAMLRDQLMSLQYHVVGLQETRCNVQTIFSSENFYRFTSGMDERRPGYWGCELWFSRGTSIATSTEGRKVSFDIQTMTVLHAHPRLRAVHAKVAGNSIVYVSAHAPHEGADDAEKDEWWTMFRKLAERHLRIGRWCIMGDFNARFGLPADDSIGELVFEDADNDNGGRLRIFCSDFSFWIPTTFQECHYGQSTTWTHPRGTSQARIDYVLIWGEGWTSISSTVDTNIVTSNCARDHEVVCVDLTWTSSHYTPSTKPKNYDWEAMHTEEGKAILQSVVDPLPAVDWHIDVHEHWQILEDALHHSHVLNL